MFNFSINGLVFTKRTNSHLADVELQKWHRLSGRKIQSALDGAKPAMGKVFKEMWAVEGE